MNDAHNPAAAVIDEPATSGALDIQQIMAILPHRYPFLLLDRIVESRRKERIVAIKNVTINEPFLHAHFPEYPIMPGVLVVDAMAQGGAVLLPSGGEARRWKVRLVTGVERG